MMQATVSMRAPRGWQFSYDHSHIRHSWPISTDRSVSAMILLLVLLALGAWAAIATIVELRRDGYRRVPTDWNRVAQHDAIDGAAPGHVYR